jgi:hypothetical protein
MEKNQSKLTACENCLEMTETTQDSGLQFCAKCGREKSGCVSMSQARRIKFQKESK